MSDVLHVDDSNFEAEVVNAKSPVLVDFSATWCGPCQRQLPILEKFASANLDKVKVVKIDIDDSPKTAGKLGIRSVPSIVLFNQGEKIDMKVGLSSLGDLNTLVTKANV
jgi:thioredoxin 1